MDAQPVADSRVQRAVEIFHPSVTTAGNHLHASVVAAENVCPTLRQPVPVWDMSPRVQDVDSRMFPAALERIVPLGNEQRSLL